MPRIRSNWLLLLLLIVSFPLYASDAMIVMVPSLSLVAVMVVLATSVLTHRSPRICALAVAVAIAAAAFVWFIPNALIPAYPWRAWFLAAVAFLPPLFLGCVVVRLASRVKISRNGT